jgi:hypothetical protein
VQQAAAAAAAAGPASGRGKAAHLAARAQTAALAGLSGGAAIAGVDGAQHDGRGILNGGGNVGVVVGTGQVGVAPGVGGVGRGGERGRPVTAFPEAAVPALLAFLHSTTVRALNKVGWWRLWVELVGGAWV